jgi:hypothetical protein
MPAMEVPYFKRKLLIEPITMTSSPKTSRALLLAVFGLLVLISACSRKKTGSEKPLRNRSANNILNNYEERLFTFDYLTMRVSADVKTPKESQGFKINIRMKSDSIIWMSISPLMGIEMLRVQITPDSVKYVSKVPGDRHFFLGTLDQLAAVVQTDLDFSMLESILVGNAVQLDVDEDRFATRIDERDYVLFSRYNRKLKKVVGNDEKKLSPDDTVEVNITDKKYQRIIRRSEEEELMVKRYWISGDHFRVTKTQFDDLYYQQSLLVEHSNFQEDEGQLYPEKTSVTANSPEGTATFKMEVTRIKRYDTLDFPFEIPEDYERKYLP